MTESHDRGTRFEAIINLLLDNPDGLRPAEIARHLGVNRSTISRYTKLPDCIYEENGRWRVDRARLPIEIEFSLDEALAVHLATRMLATRTDRQNPHAALAIQKLSKATARMAPLISRSLRLSADWIEEATLRDDLYRQALETLARAWAESRKVRIMHRSIRTNELAEFILKPYFIEPNAIGQSTYVIGPRDPDDALRTLKIERIESVELLNERYTIPEDFDATSLLANAWGIWLSDHEPVEIRLRFSPKVARRVCETRWHVSERIDELEDGGVAWTAAVAEPREMLPWIRGWGAEVEVLAPAELRGLLVEELQRMNALYGTQD